MEDPTVLLFYFISEGVIAFMTVLGNSIVLIAIMKNRLLQTPTHMFIGHLAAADFISGVLVTPLAIINSLQLNTSFHECILINNALVIFANSSIIMLVCVTCERFVSIRFSFKYIELLDTHSAHYIALAAWTVGIVTGLIPLFGWNKGASSYGTKCSFHAVMSRSYLFYFQFLIIFCLPIILMTCVYAYIGVVVRRHREFSQDLESRFDKKMEKNVRSTWSFVLIVAVLFVLKLPLKLLNTLAYFEVSFPWTVETESVLIRIFILMSRSNSMVNPFIYAYSNTTMRAAILNVITKARLSSELSELTGTSGVAHSTTHVPGNQLEGAETSPTTVKNG